MFDAVPEYRDDPFAVDALQGIGGDLDRAFEGARRSRIRHLVVTVGTFGAIAVTGVVALVAAGVVTSGADIDMPLSAPATVSARPSGTAATLPEGGSGTFHRVPGTGKPGGTGGRVLRYAVEVEGGIGRGPVAFAQEVERILGGPRGWTAGGRRTFQRVRSSPDFVVRLASAQTTEKLCSAYKIRTEGAANCTAGRQIVLNLHRWAVPESPFDAQPAEHRAYVLNHEMGRRLGLKAMACPGEGRAAPVMQTQHEGLNGCTANAWPFDRRARFLSGPDA
ncbi:DUF3152 domain-containing protein [Actinomadura flavalba]|uniref:DUF3152 domain-containing protein n=1 Tax=Actinomadura flavalba TaxID=1120938 RepID=UPI0003A62EB8|nr:DUF3152 domain-containing protein [Actinomadura flavalba]